MGYFDGLTAALFKTDDAGRTLFFPHGSFGRGFVVPAPERAAAMRKTITIAYAVMLGAIILGPIVASTAWALAWGVGTGLLFLVWYYGWAVPRFTADLSPADARMTYGEAFRSSSKAFGQGTLVGLQIISVLLLCSGIWLVTQPGSGLIGTLSIVLFGLASVKTAAMIRTSRA